jgi:phytoene dehydrogenase-like protein
MISLIYEYTHFVETMATISDSVIFPEQSPTGDARRCGTRGGFMSQFVVIGGGIAGLTAANALANTGAKVTIFEQARELGGRAQTRQVSDYFLNLGPHALYAGGVAARTFAEWDVHFSGANPTEEVKGLRAVLVRGDVLFPAVKGFGSILASRLFSFREKLELARLFASFREVDADTSENLRQWLDERVRSERVREFIQVAIRTATYAVAFDYLSARSALQQLSLALKPGVIYLDGGWQTLVDGLTRRAVSRGVQIRTGVRLTSLSTVSADGIILATDPETVEQLTGVTLPPRKAIYAASLDLCLSGLPAGAPTAAFALDRPLYYSVHSAVARLAPPGEAVVHVMKYLQEESSEPASVRAELEQYADLLMPGWRTNLKKARYVPNLRVSASIPGTQGRADVLLPNTGGLAIAGDWVGPEGMLADAAVSSALRAARLIANRISDRGRTDLPNVDKTRSTRSTVLRSLGLARSNQNWVGDDRVWRTSL